MLYYIQIFIITLFLTVGLAFLVIKLAKKLKITDKPDEERKIHAREVPLLGGLAIFAAFFIILYFTRDNLLTGNLLPRHWLGFFVGACFLMAGGFLDDKYNLKPAWQIIWPVLAIGSVIAGSVQIEKITNPFGGFIYLGAVSAALIAFWLLGMMYTTKLLDGLDGLVSGMTAIGSFIIFLFTMSDKYYQPDIGLAALILAAASMGFLFLNWHPAKIFLGEGGSLFLGYALGVLSIISGGKIAIALLVMGIPILDVAWTIVRRLVAGKNPFRFADNKHLHFRLLNMGLGVKKSVLLFYGVSIIFGLAALFLQSKGKALALIALSVIMILIVMFFAYLDRKSKVA
ncbi:undecaprenyl/decaprenyl-phosphate alpha-N-acetylglucosaminyl 1-phosphate transferase [Candidatus Falkowbacteria bacterium]|nr:undecaprenyl/decaprenyl-phosphate alpha-N-acetylglucosaminyl 1-phosphate transferase [Candidatus Falkowbacteria bacterium]